MIADPLAYILGQVTEGIEKGLRPMPSTIAALRRVNGALARQMAKHGWTPDKYDEPFTGQPEPEPEPEPEPPTASYA